MPQEEQERLKGITYEVSDSPDMLLCYSDLVEVLVSGPIKDEEDPVAIAFHALIFQECIWTLTSMAGYADCFEIANKKYLF